MNFPLIAKAIFFIALGAYAANFYNTQTKQAGVPNTKETAFERVMRTNTLRCGYILWAPYFVQDLENKEMSGIVYDFVTAITQELGIKVEWTEEVGWGNFTEGLKTNRYDAVCMPIYETGLRAREVLMTTTLYNDGLYAFGRTDDNRFNTSLAPINNANVSIALVDGEAVGVAIKRNKFPKAKVNSLPQMVDQGQYMVEIATRKSDVGFGSVYNVNKYNEGTGKKLKILGGGKPLSLYGNSIAVKLGEYDLKFAIDSAINSLLKNGTAKRIIESNRQVGFSLPEN